MGLSTLTYSGYSSTQASFFWDTRVLEIGARASARLLGSLGVGRTEVNNKLADWNETYSVEIARRFISREGRYGRIGLQYDQFSPNEERFLHLAIDTGILDTPEEPTLIRMSFHLFRPLKRTSDTRLNAGIETGLALVHKSQQTLKIGLGLGWNYHLSKEQELGVVNALPDKTFVSEHMFLTGSPWVEYFTPRLIARVAFPLRLFIDKSWQARPAPKDPASTLLVVSHPLEATYADIWGSVTFLL